MTLRGYAGERCRADARMIRVKTVRGEKFFANEGKNAITSQLDIMPEGGMTVRREGTVVRRRGKKKGSKSHAR